MAFFGRKDKVVDLTERYKKQQRQADEIKSEMREERPKNPMSLVREGAFSIFGSANPASTVSTTPNDFDSNSDAEERKRKLAKRLSDMTEKLEDLGNQIYHLTQRMEVIEKKLNVSRFD